MYRVNEIFQVATLPGLEPGLNASKAFVLPITL